MQHAVDTGLKKSGGGTPAREVEEFDDVGNLIKTFYSMEKVGEKLKLHSSTIGEYFLKKQQ